MRPTHVAARAGSWSARHRKAAVLAWVAFVVGAVALGQVLVGSQPAGQESVGESGRADRIVQEAFPDRAGETVLLTSTRLTTDDPAFRAAVDDVVRRLERRPEVHAVASPYAAGNGGQIAADRRAALVGLELRGDAEQSADVEAALAATEAAAAAHPQLRIEQFGEASAHREIEQMFEVDFRRAELLSIPITLAILVLAFGAFVAAGIPLLLALSSVAATLGLVALASHLLPIDDTVASVVLLIGLAVGVDYSLFYLRREREERAAGRETRAAIEAAAATSGRAVLVSGITVMISMAGMFIAGAATFTGMALGAILVVGVSLIASLTVLPAVLSLLGDRVERGRIPLLMRRRGAGVGTSRAWTAVIDAVLRRPRRSLLLAGGGLLALCLPALGMHTAVPGTDALPRSLPVMQTYDRIQERFPGREIAATVVVQSDELATPAGQAALRQLRRDALARDGINEPIRIELAPGRRVAAVSLPIDGDGADETSMHVLETIRGELTPAVRETLPGATVAVTGMTAGDADFNALMQQRIGWVLAFVLTLAFLLLLATFRSLVIAITAIVLNLLSVGAAYGLLVVVFQHGWGESLLDFRSTGAITSWLPLFLFVVLFGLSMDYHVFILSRIREAYDRGLSTDEAVRHGITTTAGTVTSAAIIMVAVFAVFATLSTVEFKQLGIGLSAAILIDATIVRAVLVPATMTLLGERNWYVPGWLEWLPRLHHELPQASSPAPAPEPDRERVPEPVG